MVKPNKYSIIQRSILGLCLLVSIFFLFGVFAVYDIQKVSDLSRTIYNHPLVVSNAALQANVSIGKMQRCMKDVVLFPSSSRIRQWIEAVNREEEHVYQQLNIVKKNILGEEGKALEKSARKIFEEWRPIRNEVIELVYDDQLKNAANITITNGADHVALLDKKMDGLNKYARNKASDFFMETEARRSKLIVNLIFFLVLGVCISIPVALFIQKLVLFADKELQKSEKRYRSLIESQVDLICRFTPDGKFIFVNEMYTQFFNKSRKELIGSKWKPLSVDDDIEMIEKKLSEMSSTSPVVTIENRVCSGNGEIRWMQFINQGFFDQNGNLLEIQSVGRDITKLKQIDQELRKSEAMLNEMGHIAKIGAWEMDLASRTAKWTRGTYDIVEIDYDQPIPGPDEHVDYYLPEYRPMIIKAMQELVEENQPLYFEAKLTTAKGNIKWCRAIGKAEFRNGVCFKIRGTFQDISEQKSVELKIKDYADKQAVLLEEINHRVKNNLAVIVGMLHKEEDCAAAKGQQGLVPLLKDIENRISGLLTVHNMLSATNWNPLRLDDICHNIIKGILVQRSRAIELKVSPSKVMMDSSQAHHLSMIINELTTNMIKYAITETDHPILRIAIKQENENVTLKFKDNGPGFPQAIIDGDKNLISVGLPMVKGIVEKSLGGTLSYYNDNGAVINLEF